jgi:SAM-dependent methyltransferase
MVVEERTIDEARLGNFLGTVVNDIGGLLSSALVLIGEDLGLYEAMADGEPVNSTELAAETGANERYLRDWLVNQAAGGYVEYDVATDRYRLPYEHALVLAGRDGPADVPGGFRTFMAAIKAQPRIAEVMRTGGGMPWGDHDHDLFEGTERFFRAIYSHNLISTWIPALDGVEKKLKAGATVADIGCGHGASTILMAEAFPASRFFGFDFHGPSIERARVAAEAAGVADRITFEVADAAAFPGTNYDLITFFDCFHDLPNPGNAANRACQALVKEGTLMVVEPMAGRTTEENLNPIGRLGSAASVLVCTPNALSGGDFALGTIATDNAIADVLRSAGFTRFRRAAETPFNRVFEVRR